MRLSTIGQVAVICAGLAAMVAGPAAEAQAPPPLYPAPVAVAPPGFVPPPGMSPEASEIAACLCLRQTTDALGADMSSRQRSHDELLRELTRLDAQMAQERGGLDVNNPQSVARFRQLLEQRDAVFRRSSGPASAELSSVTARYNSGVNEYNARCADRPRNPVLVGQVQATLSCPPP